MINYDGVKSPECLPSTGTVSKQLSRPSCTWFLLKAGGLTKKNLPLVGIQLDSCLMSPIISMNGCSQAYIFRTLSRISLTFVFFFLSLLRFQTRFVPWSHWGSHWQGSPLCPFAPSAVSGIGPWCTKPCGENHILQEPRVFIADNAYFTTPWLTHVSIRQGKFCNDNVSGCR